MRTPSITSLQEKVVKLEGQVSKLKVKQLLLAETKVLLENMNSPEAIQAARVRLEKKRAELEKLEAFINGQEDSEEDSEEDSPESPESDS